MSAGFGLTNAFCHSDMGSVDQRYSPMSRAYGAEAIAFPGCAGLNGASAGKGGFHPPAIESTTQPLAQSQKR